MEVTAEERDKIYREEKAKMESQSKYSTQTCAHHWHQAWPDHKYRGIHSTRAGRLTSSAFAIAWSIAFMIFFNFFYQYIAYYHTVPTPGGNVLVTEPLLTGNFSLWLPIITSALIFSILGHVILIIFDTYTLREVVTMVLDIIGIGVMASLLSLFPFDFSPLPNPELVTLLPLILRLTMAFIIAVLSVSVIVRLIRLTVNLACGTANYQTN